MGCQADYDEDYEEDLEKEKKMEEQKKQEKQNKHLDRTIKDLGYEEITQGDYRRLKREDKHNVNGYTIRIRFKYYKLKAKLTEFEQHLISYFKEDLESFERICKELKNE